LDHRRFAPPVPDMQVLKTLYKVLKTVYNSNKKEIDMTSLKLFCQRGAPAALVLGLIVGAPDIAQAFTQLRGGFVSPPRHPAPYLKPKPPEWCWYGRRAPP
jgi:hypothetical protein